MTKLTPSEAPETLVVERDDRGCTHVKRGRTTLLRTKSVIRADAFRAGYHAGWHGIDRSKNPYKNPKAAQAWRSGHALGVEAYERRDPEAP